MSNSQQMRKLMETVKVLSEGKYWSQSGKYEKEGHYLESLMPGSGPAETQRGEIIRAASKIYYDYYNNGFGNSWPQALAFLIQNTDISEDVVKFLSMYANGNVHGNTGGNDDHYLEKMMDEVIRYAMDDVPEDKPAVHDMWDTNYAQYDFDPEDYGDDDEDDHDGLVYDDEEDEDDH